MNKNIIYDENSGYKNLTITDRVKISFHLNSPLSDTSEGYKLFVKDELKSHGFDLNKDIDIKHDSFQRLTIFKQKI